MKKKKCTKCGKLKPLSEFYKRKAMSDGHRSRCKSCRRKTARQKYRDNLSPEQLKKYNRDKKRKKLLKKGKFICSKCKEIKPLTEFYKDSQHFHGYGYVCKDCEKKNWKKYKNKMKQDPEWVESRRNSSAKYRESKKDDPQFKLNGTMSSDISEALQGNKNGRHWEDLVGYTLDELKKHLEKQFTDEMSWDNYGSYWHLDHVFPKSAFNYTKPEHIGFKKCWALENLQPLEAKENIRKSNKLIKPKQEYLTI